MNRKLMIPSVLALMMITSSCAPVAEDEELKPLTEAQKVTAFRLQQPLAQVVDGMNMTFDSTFAPTDASDESVAFAKSLQDNCEIAELKDDNQLPNPTKKYETSIVEIKRSTAKPNCPMSATITRRTQKVTESQGLPRLERGEVRIVVLQNASTVAALMQFNRVQYDYAIKYEDPTLGSESSSYLSTAGTFERLDGTKLGFGSSNSYDLTITQRKETETRKTSVAIKFPDARAVWDQVTSLENSVVTNVINRFNDQPVTISEFEVIREAASN